MEQWYAVYEKATGRLHATGTVVANPLPAELAVVSLPFNPQAPATDGSTYVWSETGCQFERVSQNDLKARELGALETQAAQLRAEIASTGKGKK